MPYFINRTGNGYTETVDEYDTKEEALKMLAEYQLADHGRAFYVVSARPCANWRD